MKKTVIVTLKSKEPSTGKNKRLEFTTEVFPNDDGIVIEHAINCTPDILQDAIRVQIQALNINDADILSLQIDHDDIDPNQKYERKSENDGDKRINIFD